MPNPLIAKLEHGADLTDADRHVLDALTQHPHRVAVRQDIIREGERPDNVHLILDGLACRYKTLPDGKHQMVALLLPGDFCDLHVAILDVMDHSIATLSACTLVEIPRATILDLTEHHPRIARALWWCTLVDEAILREWIMNLGQREAHQRMAHLFCELLVRLEAVGFADGSSYELPISQAELGEALGISPVHVNRTLQYLRDQQLIEFKGKRVTLPDVERLKAFCSFDSTYLHLTKRRAGADGAARL